VATGYVPILILAAVAGLFAVLSIGASALLRPSRPMAAKTAPYESGITPFRLPAGERFHVKFYVVAMLFIIFDIETIFLFPWAVAYRSLGLFGLIEMVVFIGLVFVAYLFVWQKGGLEWEGPEARARLPRFAWAGGLPSSVERGPGETTVVEPVPVGSATAPAGATALPAMPDAASGGEA
jgi:NADH-quinone oxidoreductase subunit A